MNFCVEKIGTTITSSQVESDGHEAKNLLEPDPPSGGIVTIFGNRSRGFLTDNFVRPPVTLSLRFPVCIEISHIVINPKLGTQTSSAFMIQTETSYSPWKSGQEINSTKHLVAKEYLNSTIPNRIIFRNPRFVPRSPFSLLRTASSSKTFDNPNDELQFNLKHPSINACERVIGLELTILRISGSSVPALGGIEVWGQPCVRCTKEVANKLLVTWMRRTRKRSAKEIPDDSEPETDADIAAKRRRLRENAVVIEPSVEIPEDFLDPITHEIMCQPIRLPCGVAVDSSTLERYYKEEATWARTPNDPFTGQAYTDTIKPIADGALKTRIDYFITHNANCKSLQSVPRTLGTGLTGIKYKGLSRPQFVTFEPKIGLQSSFNSYSSDSGNQEQQPNSSSSSSRAGDMPTASTSTSESNPIPKTAPKLTSNPISMQSLLQAEMAKILGGGSSYVVKPPDKPPPHYSNQCLKCHKNFEQMGNAIVYSSTTCSHIFVCRPCILTFDKQAIQKCSECNFPWNIKNLQRNHDYDR